MYSLERELPLNIYDPNENVIFGCRQKSGTLWNFFRSTFPSLALLELRRLGMVGLNYKALKLKEYNVRLFKTLLSCIWARDCTNNTRHHWSSLHPQEARSVLTPQSQISWQDLHKESSVPTPQSWISGKYIHKAMFLPTSKSWISGKDINKARSVPTPILNIWTGHP